MRSLPAFVLTLLVFPALPALAQSTAPSAMISPAALLQSGIYQEETVGDLDAASKVYRQLLDNAATVRTAAAQAAYRLGNIQLRQQKNHDAAATFTLLIHDFSDDKKLVEKAKIQLAFANAAPLDYEKLKSGQILIADTSSMDLELTLRDLEQRLLNDSAQHQDQPGPDADYLTHAKQAIITELTRRGYSFDGDLVLQRPTPSQPATATAPDPRAAEQLATRAWQLWGQQKFADAESLFQQATVKDPSNANIWNGLGWSQLNQGKKENARAAFEKAIALDPKAAASWNGLGWITKGDGKTDDALGYWQKAYDAAPTATAAISGLASTYAELGDNDQALLWYQRWLNVEPANPDAKAGLQSATIAQALVRTSMAAAQVWLEKADDGQSEGTYTTAAPVFQKALTLDQWKAALHAARDPFGKVLSRKLLSALYKTHLPGAPDGKYVVFHYQTDFENKKAAIETLTPALGADGRWHVAGYYIK